MADGWASGAQWGPRSKGGGINDPWSAGGSKVELEGFLARLGNTKGTSEWYPRGKRKQACLEVAAYLGTLEVGSKA